ncbi:flagellar hook basal-body protein [Microbulbifer sp. SAOS-129_SWC]|uniref:flagellar hook-basal body protein n=1 Tax=Microbulbifer sp. SAOS-129_SWC TaxID=3145235 RepID=UPI00321685CA
MDSVLAIAEANISGKLEQLSAISNNIANVNTTGYRSKLVVEAPFESAVAAVGGGSVPSTETHVDLSVGSMRETGRSLDIALSGSGFFQLESPMGDMLTRNGQFDISEDGRLVGINGWPVKVDGQMEPFTRDIQIAKDGHIYSKGKEVGRIELADANENSLVEFNSGVFKPKGNVTLGGEQQLLQSHLEGSNVDLLSETTRMMMALRSVEATQKLVHSYDSLLDTAITTLGEF